MPDRTHEIPPGLRRLGITEVTDNIPEGHQVRAPSLPFVTLFGRELQVELARRRAEPEAES